MKQKRSVMIGMKGKTILSVILPLVISLVRSTSSSISMLPIIRRGSWAPAFLPAAATSRLASCASCLNARRSTRRMIPVATLVQSTTRTSAALGQVRDDLKKKGIDVFIIPSADEHLSEYAAEHFCRRAFISGFDGSAGTAIITQDRALLWTDGRYHLQAEQQLGLDWTLMREGQKDVPNILTYLKENLKANAVVGLDPTVHPAKFVQSLSKTLSAKQIKVRPLGVGEANPIDVAWGKERPPAPQSPVRVHPIRYAGETVPSKIQKIKTQMEKDGVDLFVAGTLDEVAWLLNIRGDDVPNCPLAMSYAALELNAQAPDEPAKALMFVDDAKLGPEALKHLKEDCQVEIRGYGEIFSYIRDAVAEGKKAWLDPDKSNYALFQAAGGKHEVMSEEKEGEESQVSSSLVSKVSPIILLKALKNPVELEGMKAAHLRDGAAEVEFLAWLDKEVQSRSISEIEIDQVLTGFRARREKFLGLSFDTIAGSGGNGAIIHYRATPEKHGFLNRNKMLLLDSGAQYEDGTTDVTRTVHFGEATEEERESFTRVLQGHIGIDTAIFPEGTPGFVIDAYARRSLWQAGLDYAHGTGHGVGAALNVHEGPQGISFNFANQTPLQVGMVLSNEPGYYAAGRYGIRIENLLIVVVRKEGGERDPRNRKFLGFERLTHIPISKRLIMKELLQPFEEEWIDGYHQQVWEKISPLVTTEEARQWLKEATSPL